MIEAIKTRLWGMLEQKDENNRPDRDPQVEAALLLLLIIYGWLLAGLLRLFRALLSVLSSLLARLVI